MIDETPQIVILVDWNLVKVKNCIYYIEGIVDMSDRVHLEAEPRTLIGKRVKKLRQQGWVPAVIYGQRDTYHIQVENLALRRALREAGMTQLIDIDVNIDDGRRTVLAREIQTHVTRGDVLHVDFYEVDMKQTIVSEAALISTGQSQPEEDGLGATVLVVHAIEIECLPDNLISEVEVDLTQIETPDDVILVKDLPIPAGVTVLTDPETTVAKFEYTRLEEEEEEEEEVSFLEPDAEDVEVIGRGKQEEEEEFEE